MNYDPDNTLAGGLFAMTPRECIQLGTDLCAAVEMAVGADGCHGGIWPGSVTWVDGQVAVGPVNQLRVAELSKDMMEFVSPEQFWSGESSPASDVYSIGLVLYTALNRGIMPYFDRPGEHTPEERTIALQSRMKGVALPYPATAGRQLGEVILKALAFQPGDRYPTPGQLKAALESLPDGAEVAAAVPVVQPSREEVFNTPVYKVDKDFEETAPEKPKVQLTKPPEAPGTVDENITVQEFREGKEKKSRAFLIPVLLFAAIIVVAVIYLLRGCQNYDEPFPVTTESPDPRQTTVETDDPSLSVPLDTNDELIHSPVPETANPWESGGVDETGTASSGEANGLALPRYQIIRSDAAWTEAKALAEQAGGHLATVRNQAELDEIIRLAEENGAQFVWLGASRSAADEQWRYVTGDPLEFTSWDTGEPSARDVDGTREDYLLLWYRPAVGYWSYNDQRDDPVTLLPASYRGKLAYAIQYDDVS